jgi:hypothetical protein
MKNTADVTGKPIAALLQSISVVSAINPLVAFYDIHINTHIIPGYNHHQPINVPTAGAQAFLMDYPQGERAITHHAASADWWVLTTANAA